MIFVAITAFALRVARASPWLDLTFVALLSLDSWLTATGMMEHISRDDHGGHFLLTVALVPMLAALIARVSGPKRTIKPAKLVALHGRAGSRDGTRLGAP
ncbi:MAG: hypothetical protein ACSLFF_06695 [Solirubrobacterales bacterium]